jgi:Resolvase, N terminal domain
MYRTSPVSLADHADIAHASRQSSLLPPAARALTFMTTSIVISDRTMAKGSFVAYYRVSTERQGRSGLGLEAQQEAVRSYLNGGRWRLDAEVIEIESGKRSDRPKLAEALRLCRLHGAKLIIARLDRLARNVAFVSALMESGVDFVAVDFPQANRLTVHILAAVAEHEAKAISERTKAALAAAKARGKKLGGHEDRRRRQNAFPGPPEGYRGRPPSRPRAGHCGTEGGRLDVARRHCPRFVRAWHPDRSRLGEVE